MPEEISAAPLVEPDEYAALKPDLQRTAEKGQEALDEATPARKINASLFRLQSRYGTIVRTGADGIKEAQFCGKRKNRKGRDQTERIFIGIGAEAFTKDSAYKSELVSKTKRVVNHFEATLSAAPLIKATIEEAQKKGDAIQKKIDEENYEHFEFFPPAPSKASLTLRGEPAPVDAFGNLFAAIEQEIDSQLGAKVDKCEILSYLINDCSVITAADGTSIDVVNPMFALNVQVKTKEGSVAFGCLRGSGGGLEVIKRNHPERSYEEIVTSLARNVAHDAIDLDRAQGAAILGSECPVIMGSHASSVLIHEVYGHASEADIICENRRSKTAKISLKGRIGAQVSDHPALTIYDSGERDITIAGRPFRYCWGSIPCDEHGQPPKATLLVERGVQVGVLTGEVSIKEIIDGLRDDVAKRITEHGLSGNMRGEKFDLQPIVRMTNTYLLPDPKGPKTLEAMAAMVPKNQKGVYVKRCGGGWVNTESGDFCVKGELCYLIENGLITDKPVKSVSITGNIGKFGNQIKAIGAVESIDDRFSGFCGKDSQYVPVDGIAPPVYCENVKLGSGFGFSFMDIAREYLRQMNEKQQGKRDYIYVAQIDEVSRIKDHDNLLMVCEALPDDEELSWVLGRKDRTDYVFEGEELKDRRTVT